MQTEPDLCIRISSLREYNADTDKNYTLFATPDLFCKHWKNVGTFLFRGGKEVIIDPSPAATEKILSSFVTGAVMAVVLHQRGYLVLHASAARLGNSCIAFLGDSGKGKSTLAAYLQTQGAYLLTDDALPISFSGDVALSVPGYPQIRLWMDSVRSLGLDPAKLSRVYDSVEKKAYRFQQEDTLQEYAVTSIFIIDEGPEIRVDRIDKAVGFIDLTKNAFMARYLVETKRAELHFAQTQKLLEIVPVYRLQRPKKFELLPEVARAIASYASLRVHE